MIKFLDMEVLGEKFHPEGVSQNNSAMKTGLYGLSPNLMNCGMKLTRPASQAWIRDIIVGRSEPELESC